MADLLASRPRYDTSDVYFTTTYQLEVHCLDLTAELLLAIAQHQLKEDRKNNQLFCTQGGWGYMGVWLHSLGRGTMSGQVKWT